LHYLGHMPAIDSFDALAVKPAHDGVDVHRCAVQVWERRVVRVKHRGQIRASQQDRIHAVSLDERLGLRDEPHALCLALLGRGRDRASDLVIGIACKKRHIL
jgi:hypothetical protein